MFATLILVLFLLIALAMIIACFFPNWNFSAPVLDMRRVFGLIVGLIVLWIIWYLVSLVLGSARLP